MGKRELDALLNSSSWCLVMVEQLFLAVPRDCLQFVIVVFPDHTHLLFKTHDDESFKYEENLPDPTAFLFALCLPPARPNHFEGFCLFSILLLLTLNISIN